MKRQLLIFVLALSLSFVFVGIAKAAPLQVIGMATYLGFDYNLVYEESQKLVWLDYSNLSDEDWFYKTAWAESLGALLTININPIYITDNNWMTNWRLPSIDELVSLHINFQFPGGFFDSTPFKNLETSWYWSSTDRESDSDYARILMIGPRTLHSELKTNSYPYALAVRTGQVAVVPEISTILLLAFGIAGLGLYGYRRRSRA